MRIRNLFDLESGMEKFGSGMEKEGSGIRDKHPGYATLLISCVAPVPTQARNFSLTGSGTCKVTGAC